ncbi:MAG: hypothetical protein PHP22_10740 [Oscillospiraceae bacterium]|nr:hypothetical protein [Oscillospiraceae bacterium]
MIEKHFARLALPTALTSGYNILYDEVEDLVRSLALQLGIAAVLLIGLVISLVIIIRKMPRKSIVNDAMKNDL